MTDEIALYTAIYGGYEQPKPVLGLPIPAFLFTDSVQLAHEAEAKGWIPEVVKDHFIPEEPFHGDPELVVPMLQHKFWKCNPDEALPGAEVSIWIDGSMEILDPDAFVERCLDALGNDDWACMKHPSRDCIFTEAEYSATLTWRYDAESIEAQAEHYKSSHPVEAGLIATGFNVRRHSEIVLDTSRLWWDEIVRWSHQDQISLPVIFRLMEEKGLKWNLNLPWHEWMTHHPHGE